MGYLIDSNVIIDYLSAKLPEKSMRFMDDIINDTPIISVITKIEVLGYNNPPETETLLKDFIESCVIIPLSEAVIDSTIEIRKYNKIKTPDAIIIASAKSSNLSLITRNITDFKSLNIDVVNPWII